MLAAVDLVTWIATYPVRIVTNEERVHVLSFQRWVQGVPA
jgi:hypothetical protein